MDTPPYAYPSNITQTSKQSRNYNTLPPWRNTMSGPYKAPWTGSTRTAQKNKGDKVGTYSQYNQPGVNIYTVVDSWRSYATDTTNLQSTATTSSNLNATAPEFKQKQNASQYKPYESLRTSNGLQERKLVQEANKTLRKDAKAVSPGTFRDNDAHYQVDDPVPSIESVSLDYFLRNNRLDKALESLQNENYRSISPSTKGLRAKQRKTPSPAPPSLTSEYRLQAQKEPVKLEIPRKLLVILDLNGTLLYRVKNGSRSVHVRPGVTPLLEYLFTNHVVMLYTSAMPESAKDMVGKFLHPNQRNRLAAVWARDKLDLTPQQYNSKVQVYKKLDKVWADEAVQVTAGAGKQWNQSNTILIDDSELKAKAQPHNLLQVTEYTKQDDPTQVKDMEARKQRIKVQTNILKQLELKLEELKYQEDVSRLIRKWQAGQVAVPKMPGQIVSVDEDVDQSQPSDSASVGTSRSHMPTLEGVQDGDNARHPIRISDDEDDDGGIILSADSTPRPRSKLLELKIPDLNTISEDEGRGSRQGSESSVDEAVFQQLLGSKKN